MYHLQNFDITSLFHWQVMRVNVTLCSCLCSSYSHLLNHLKLHFALLQEIGIQAKNSEVIFFNTIR